MDSFAGRLPGPLWATTTYGVVGSDGRVSNTAGTKLVEESNVDSAAAIFRHGAGFVAAWRGTAKMEGDILRIESGTIQSEGRIEVPTVGGPIAQPADRKSTRLNSSHLV